MPPKFCAFETICIASPLTANIPLGVPAGVAMASPRAFANLQKSVSLKTPLAQSAVNSPKLCPAVKSAWKPTFCKTRNIPALSAPMAGCANSVLVISDFCTFRVFSSKAGLGKTTSDKDDFPSAKNCVSMPENASRISGKLMAVSFAILTYCEPCPAKRAATLSDFGKDFSRK